MPRLHTKRSKTWGTGITTAGRSRRYVERDLDRESRGEKWRIERNKRKKMRKRVCGEPVASSRAAVHCGKPAQAPGALPGKLVTNSNGNSTGGKRQPMKL